MNLLENLQKLKGRVDEKEAQRLGLDTFERVIDRLISFDECGECQEILSKLDEHFQMLSVKEERLDKSELKEHHGLLQEGISHLQQKHGLVTQGYYMSIYMSLGMSLGLLFGMMIFNNIALGLPFGLCIGLAIGVAQDEAAKKKGLQI